MKTSGPWTWAAMGLALVLQPVAGQEVVRDQELPLEFTGDVLALVNDPGTVLLEGDASIPPDRVIQGPLAVVGGTLSLLGRVEGDVLVLNGNLFLGDGASIGGDVLVVGGEVNPGAEGRVAGLVTVYSRRLPLIREEGRLVPRRETARDRPGLVLGDSRLTIRTGRGYNRLEGLPILFGPVIRTSSRNPLRLDALAVFRTDSGFSLDDLGYWVRLEQGLGGRGRWRLGASAYSEVQPLEDRGLSDLEASLVTAIYHRDLRDHFLNEGWSAYLEARTPGAPVTARLTYQDEEHRFRAVGDPWTLLRSDAEWRPLPLISAGTFRSLEASVEVDNRNNEDDPTDGWYLRASVRRGLDADWAVPEYALTDSGPTVPAAPFRDDPTFARIDLRRYARVDPTSDLRLRLYVAGSVSEDPLPPQFQQSLGGLGSLPGHHRFALDCGAREVPALVGNPASLQQVYPRYGCDRTALIQAQYRNELDFNFGTGSGNQDWDDWRWWPNVDLTVAWILFMDAGRGWSYTPGGSDTETLADVGAGLTLGDLGLFWAYPMNGQDRRVRFFLRLQHRF